MRGRVRRLLLCAIGAHAVIACSLITDYTLGGGGKTTSGTEAGAPDANVDADADVEASVDSSACTETPCVVEIAAAGAATCARLADGTVKCWGYNVSGAVGTGTAKAHVDVPTKVALDAPADEIAMGGWAKEWPAACARHGTKIDCWGDDSDLKLGRGADASAGGFVPVPAPVAGMDSAIGGIGIGTQRICARTTGNQLACWGRTYQDGGTKAPADLSATPTAVPGTVKQVVGARALHCVLLDTDEVACAGHPAWYNPLWNAANYNMGPGSTDFVLVPGVTGIAQIAAQSTHVCALKKTGAVLCWGRNSRGELGRGTLADRDDVPAPVPLPAAAKLIATGSNHSCAVTTDDAVWCWGRNFYEKGPQDAGLPTGQCGAGPDGGLDARVTLPEKIEGLPPGRVRAIVGAYAHSCALMESGAVSCWGLNLHGELGQATGDPDAGDYLPHPKATRVRF